MKTLLGSLNVACMMLVGTRGGHRSSYWRWRRETAFGHQSSVTKRQILQALGEYCRWVAHMRRF
jgi:hypothetical protein